MVKFDSHCLLEEEVTSITFKSHLMVKGRVNTQAYSSKRDYRNAGLTFLGGESIYKPALLETIASLRGYRDVEEAKQRVSIDSKGNYKYIPSDEYLKLITRFRLNKLKIKADANSKNECSSRKG